MLIIILNFSSWVNLLQLAQNELGLGSEFLLWKQTLGMVFQLSLNENTYMITVVCIADLVFLWPFAGV